uniref:zinc finger protein 462-like n=1 Tax=Epinephelus lanceolatus TaxID=310571 RepID=UPI0014462EB8|nr:zinc finger protein 462-like [Epinephelus lanceolatus]
MQEDSMSFSTPGPMTQNQVSQVKSFKCSHCTILFKSKVYLFEHLNKVHDFDVDAALTVAGLKCSGNFKANTDNHSNTSGDDFKCQHCDFKACDGDTLNNHEKQCHKKSEDQNMIGKIIISENLETNTPVISTNQHSEAAEEKEISNVFSDTSTSKTKCTLNSSKDVKIYKRPLQTITKYFAPSSGSNGKPSMKSADSPKLLDSAKGTIILQESPSCSRPNSSGVFKVTAKPMIDITSVSDHFLLNDHLLITDLRPLKPKEQSRETTPEKTGKRTDSERMNAPPAKKAKSDISETKLPEETNASKQKETNDPEFSFEVSEDEGEKNLHLANGDTEGSKVYYCKHCDYRDMSISSVTTHYQSDHPYIRCNTAYIQDPRDASATFRCLQCPVEFVSVAAIKRHYSEKHQGAPDVFTMQTRELSLVFRCFVCPFTTNILEALENHYKEIHPKHKMDNSLMYCKYLVTGCQKGSSQSNTCETVPSPERQAEISPERVCTPSKEVKNAPSPQHPTSTTADEILYHCSKCKFSHKSTVVMRVHYQKSHPGEAVTLDKIKQSQRTPDKSPNSVTLTEKSAPQTKISGSSKRTKDKAELSQHKRTPEALQTHSELPKTKKLESAVDRNKGTQSPTKHDKVMSVGKYSLTSSSPDKLFYCKYCSYSSTNIRSVIGHHNAKHSMHALTGTEEILVYSAEVQKKKRQREAKALASKTSSGSKTSKQVKVCSEKELQDEVDEAADASVTSLNAYACAENLFYCQKCNFGNPSAKGIANHQNKVHSGIQYSMECILEHTALMRDEIKKSKSQAKEFSFSTRLPLPLMNEGDEKKFFCHFCNYRQSTMEIVMKHYAKKHRGFMVKVEQVRLYTSIVHAKTQRLHLNTTANQSLSVSHASQDGEGHKKKKVKQLGKPLPVSAPPSMKASQTQRTLQCYRCSYSTQYLNLLKRHMRKIHRANRSVTDLLRVCFRQGNIQTGYHCDRCVFSHKKAAAVYKHYQEQHPERSASLDHVTTRLYVGPETRSPKRKKPRIKYTDDASEDDGTDGSLPFQRSGQNEIKTYSCRACSFKGSSKSGLTRHYHAVHPWSVKEDGSILDVINSKKPSANRQTEDHNDKPGSFESYQVPLDFDKSPDSSSEETASSTLIKCPYCPASFHSYRGLHTHCGMKHHKAANDDSDKQQEQLQTGMHVLKCPHCTYVNSKYQGVLTHCQMKHPALVCSADSHYVDEEHSRHWGVCLKSKGPGCTLRLRGYMCESCPKICSTQEKLNRHCKKVHTKTMASTVPNTLKPSKPSAVSKIKQFKTLSNWGLVSQASFLRKKIYAVVKCQYCAYSCSTKIALGRHVRVHHKNAPVSKVQDHIYKCVLCSISYFEKVRLASHYIKKHGRDSFLKYYVPVYKHGQEKPAPTSPDHPLTQQPEIEHEACKSSTTTDENKKLVYRCPCCSYVNASYHGTLTHCQMKHPDLIVRADRLQTDEVVMTNMVGCSVGKGANERGYMCKRCPLIYPSMKKLKIHCERDHNQASEPDTETEKQPDHSSQGSPLSTEIGFSHQLGTPETSQSNAPSVQNMTIVYKCHICNYKGFFRRYLQCHYKKTHKMDPFTIHKLLEKYNKRKRKASKLPEAESEKDGPMKCKKCPEFMFDSSELLAAHYSAFHSLDSILDFTVLSTGKKKGSTGLYRCVHCYKQMNGIRKLWYHLDCHRESARKRAMDEKTTASLDTTTPEAKSIKLCKQDVLLKLENVEELAQWNVTPVETFVMPPSPLPSPSKSTELEQPELESREDKHTCEQCGRSFMSLKGLRSHERSHAAMAAIRKNRDNLPTTVLKHSINKYVIYKSGTTKPFLCSLCSYRTTIIGLWRSHFMKSHEDVIMNHAETDSQDESGQRTNEEPYISSEESNNWPEPDEEPDITDDSQYSEPPDVQRQLNHYTLMAQANASSKANGQETMLPDNSLLHCEFCNFNTGHMSSVRRHYLNRHGKKFVKCKDCDFFTGSKKTLEMHMATGHSTCQSEPTHHKDLRCPFCLYQTKNKNNMIDHIVLHREERVVPIEVRRSKLSRYLQGIVFRCHKCTFTCGSAENLRLHMTKHDDNKPYKCRLCYFDCTQLRDLEAHLSDKHQVVRNHELVGQISLDQLQARDDRMPEEEEEPASNLEHHDNDSEDAETDDSATYCIELPDETRAKNMAENNVKEKITPQTEEEYQKQEQDDDENSPAESSVLDLKDEDEDTKPNTAVQEKREPDPQEQAVVCLSAQTKRRDSEDSSTLLTQQKEEAAEKTPTQKLHKKALKQRMLDIEASVEHNILQNIMLLDEDGSVVKKHKKAAHDRMVRKEQNIESQVVDKDQSEMMFLDTKDSITLAHNPENQANIEEISALGKKNQMQPNNSRARKSLSVERHSHTPPLMCAELKISHEESLDVSITNCKKEQVQNSEEARDLYGEMPVLENENLKEEMQPIECCKKEDEDDVEQRQDKEDETITADDENRCADQKHEEDDRMEDADDSRAPKGAPTVTDEAPEVLCPAVTDEKHFTCELCGRNLTNSYELKRHFMRHRI